MESQIKKLTLSFNLNDSKDKLLWKQLSEVTKQAQISKSKRNTSRSDILKQFIRPISGKELLQLQKSMLSYQDRMEIWRSMFSKQNEENISLEKFVVEVMPKLKEKDLDELEINFFSSINSKENSRVQTH